MENKVGENLRRLMSQMELTIAEVSRKTGLDKRTIRGILEGSKKPHPKTIGRLAQGLGVAVDEFYLEPSQLLFRRFDRQTNPLLTEFVTTHPDWFKDWSPAEFDELVSRVGTGGPMTTIGISEAVQRMNRRRELQQKVAVVMETDLADLLADVIERFYRQVQADPVNISETRGQE
ncbi:hypothetical protein JCM19992_09910 [Thermostilla marina]